MFTISENQKYILNRVAVQKLELMEKYKMTPFSFSDVDVFCAAFGK